MQIAGNRRKLIALAFLAALAALAWYTMDAGKIRLVVMILLGGFALRVALTAGTRSDDEAAKDTR
jgi:hypothetical protein